MNLILLPDETTRLVPATDAAFTHLTQVLHARAGTVFWCGVKNGSRGLATVEKVLPEGLAIRVDWEKSLAENLLPPITLLVGLSRPQTMKKILASAAELGLEKIVVFVSQNSDPSYAQSSLWRGGNAEAESLFAKAAEQTCCTAFPRLVFEKSLESALAAFSPELSGTVFDVYEDGVPANEIDFGVPALLAIGSERGWTSREREIFRAAGWRFAHLGSRVLRVETAAVFAHALALASLKNWRKHQVL